MRDFYLWIGLAALGTTACVLTIAVIRRLFDRQRERRYVPPAKLYTEVFPIAREINESDAAAVFGAFADGLTDLGAAIDDVLASSWALDALSDARKAADEDDYATLGEFARAKPQPASIWCDMVGRRTVLGLVTA